MRIGMIRSARTSVTLSPSLPLSARRHTAILALAGHMHGRSRARLVSEARRGALCKAQGAPEACEVRGARRERGEPGRGRLGRRRERAHAPVKRRLALLPGLPDHPVDVERLGHQILPECLCPAAPRLGPLAW